MELPKNKKIILFDDVCNLCNNAITTIIKNDKKNIFVFVSLQSNLGKEILKTVEIDVTKTDSIVLYNPKENTYKIKSSAALKIMEEFSGIWKITKIGWIAPLKFRDNIYDYIAKNRYKWFGKQDSCMVPTPELKAKFLE